MKLKSITSRMVLATTALVALLTIAFSQMFLYQLEQALATDFDRQARSLTENLALNAELGMLLEDRESLVALGENLLKEESVGSVRIEDREARPLVRLAKGAARPELQKVFSAVVVLSRTRDELSVYLPDRKEGERTTLGRVEVAFSQEMIRSIMKKMKWRIYSFSFLGFVIGGALAYYLARIVLNPVKRLAQASEAIAAGNWEMRVEESGDDEIGQLTRDFNLMAASLEKKRQELEESYRELSRQERMAEIGRFSTIIAHELKNPLGIIRGSINILAKRKGDKATQETMVKYINEEVTRLNHLAEDFLVFARPPQPKKEQVDLNELIHKLKALSEARGAEEKKVTVSIEAVGDPVTVLADRNQLYQALLNLVDNAIHSSPDGEAVTICVGTDDQGVSVSISDNGPGVRSEHREKIFEPFFTLKEKGTGLGLSIVKRIVEMHDGALTLGDSTKGGACFTVWLPKSPKNV
jgi:signal transduction histidine kinase